MPLEKIIRPKKPIDKVSVRT